MTLGNFPALSLKSARDKRRSYEQLLVQGTDPIEYEEIQKYKKDNSFSFEAIARDWHKEYSNTGRWIPDTANKALRNLEDYVFPLIGSKSVDEVKPKDLVMVLRSIEEKDLQRYSRKQDRDLVPFLLMQSQ